jgi:hypothetical protein
MVIENELFIKKNVVKEAYKKDIIRRIAGSDYIKSFLLQRALG